jgi:hypothetical protein
MARWNALELSANPCKNKKAFNGGFSEINTKTGVK